MSTSATSARGDEGGSANVRVRLRDRGRGIGGMRAGGTPQRGSRCECGADRGGAARHDREHPCADRVPRAVPHAGRLGLLDHGRAVRRSPAHLPAARQDPRGVVVHQRDGVHPRQPRRLRRLARRGLRGVGLGRSAALLHPRRGQRARRLGAARRRRAADGERGPRAQPDHRRLPGGVRAGGAARQRGLQRRRAGRVWPLPAHPARRAALQRRGRLPAPRDGPPQPHCGDLHAGAPHPVRGRARRRRAGRAAGGAVRAARHARDDRVRRRLQLTAAADALRGRPGRAAHDAADPSRAGPAQRRAEPPGPPRLGGHVGARRAGVAAQPA